MAKQEQKTQFEVAIEKGMNTDVIAEKLGVMYLLSCKMEEQNHELAEYLQKYGLVNNFRNDIAVLTRNFSGFHKNIIRLIDEDGKKELFKQFDKLSGIIDKYIAEERTCTSPKKE